ncbi:MAG: hypothetical protein JRF04_01220 [Deltaproteobacteria bacterium]|nr:hypothetical protein [Deltaproteobacteria bacterium]
MNYLLKYRFVFLLSLIAALLYGHFFVNRAHVQIRINSSEQTYFKIYWATSEDQYSEKKMARVLVRPGTERYSFFIADLRRINTLRIDTSEMPGEVTVKKIVIRQPGLAERRFSRAKDFARMKPLGDVQSTEFTNKGWIVHSTGTDPRFELRIEHHPRSLNWPAEITRFLLLLIPFLVLVRLLQPLWPNYTYTTYFGVLILGLILTMAVVSKRDHHPDERVHIAAAKYYETNWLPPSVDSPAIRDTYSAYGVSRLNYIEVSYFFAGKFAAILESFQLDRTLALRLFNVTLFGILACLALGNPPFRLLFVPLLLSPQIWYIFSYMNSDGFSLFVVVLAGWQMAVKDSALNRFLEQEKISLLKILGLGLLLALLIFVKKNFYFFTLFFLFFFVWRCFFYPFADFRGMLKRLSIICCVGLVLVGVRFGADISVNGFDKTEKVRAMQEITAESMYKPSTELNEKNSFLQMRDRGTSLKEFITLHRWGEKTFRSGFGTYGYMTVSGPDIYYNLVRVTGLACLLFMGISIAFRGGLSGNFLFGGAVLCSAALIAAACYHAWTMDFQAQGRYLFAIAAMIGMVLVKTEEVYNQAVLRTLCCSMFLLSVYSFVFIGLYGLVKYGWG